MRCNWIGLFSLLSLVPALSAADCQYRFETFAGLAGSAGSTDGTGSSARFNWPVSVACDTGGNVYVADSYSCTVRKITPAKVVTTLAGKASNTGSTDGTGTAARFNNPMGITVDGAGNCYVVDSYNHTIRKVTAAGVVTTIAGRAGTAGSIDGVGTAARFGDATGIVIDAAGNLYVADTDNYTIRKITSDGTVTTLAGYPGSGGSVDGTGTGARFLWPYALAIDSGGNIYVADSLNDTIRKVTSAGVVTTIAGTAGASGSTDGISTSARFYYPRGIAIDGYGTLYVGDYRNNTIRKISSTGIVSTIGGLVGSSGSTDGIGTAARFYQLEGVTVDSSGNLYVADAGNETIRKGGPIPVIEYQPASTNLATGKTLFLRAGVKCPASYYCQWKLNGTNLINGSRISGATMTNLTITSVTTNDSGTYTVVVTNYYGTVSSSSATVGVVNPPTIIVPPTGLSVKVGNNALFNVVASGTGLLGFQWMFKGTNLVNGGRCSGVLTSNLVISSVVTNDTGNYSVMVSNVNGMVTSSVALLTVGTAPTITVNPTNRIVNLGNSMAVSVSVSGTSPLYPQWRLNSLNLTNNARISGVTTTNLTVTGVTTNDRGNYTIAITNLFGSTTSSVAAIGIYVPDTFKMFGHSSTFGSNDTIHVQFANAPGQGMTILASTNLLHWFEFQIITNPISELTLPTTNKTGLFYRLRADP